MAGFSMQRPSLAGGLSATGGFLMLVGGLAMLDDRVRTQFGQVVSGRGPSDELVSIGDRVYALIAVVMQAVRDQSIDHAALVIFALAALVLVLFMTRT